MVRNTRIGEAEMDIACKKSASTNIDPRPSRASAGFTYIALLIYIAIMGAALAAAGELWHMAVQREKERELLFVGDQFRRAINQYARHAQAGSARFPMSLEDMLKDPRYPDTRRYLRRIYRDPMTDSAEWGLVKGPNGEIFGVHSLSQDEPVKKRNFSLADAAFEDKMMYSDWVFMGTLVRYGARPSKKP